MERNLNEMPDPGYYEGCGREGPIRCIFLSEFHLVAGPKISCQVSNVTVTFYTYISR